MKTQIISALAAGEIEAAVRAAVEHLRRGEAVALPTETVYGLAADALNVEAALKIFEAKERPRFDPLIVHLPELDWIDRLTSIPKDDASLVTKLAEKFWPGPLTLILPRTNVVPDIVTAGLETVAIRMSAHPVFQRIAAAFARPIAAPSANRFGRISPTQAADVKQELDGRIPLIVDGGPTRHGIESTIVAVRNGALEILRPGPITAEELQEIGEVRAANARDKPEAPGQLRSHYAPRTPLKIVSDAKSFRAEGKAIGLLTLESLSPQKDLREAATNLFRRLRELDESGFDLIVAEEIPDEGLGLAIMDRLRRAAAR